MNFIEKPSVDGMFRFVAALPRPGRSLVLLTCLAAVLLAWPLAASATTGRGITRTFNVTITDKGVSWKPSLSTLHPLVGTELKLTVVNHSSSTHWFRVGTAQTKPLRAKAKAPLDYKVKKLGKLPWLAGLGPVTGAGFHGLIRIGLPGSFS
jgi:hypothetical protein